MLMQLVWCAFFRSGITMFMSMSLDITQAIAEVSAEPLICTVPLFPSNPHNPSSPPHFTSHDLWPWHPPSRLISATALCSCPAPAQQVQPGGGSQEGKGEVRCQGEGGGGEEGKRKEDGRDQGGTSISRTCSFHLLQSNLGLHKEWHLSTKSFILGSSVLLLVDASIMLCWSVAMVSCYCCTRMVYRRFLKDFFSTCK